MTPGESAEATLMLTIPQDKYASLSTGELVLFAIQHLHADGVPAAVEEIVSACFKLFPRRFSLKHYFYWPDSALVVQALTDAKERKLVRESPAHGFILRPAGRKAARQAANTIGVPFPKPPKAEKKTVDSGPQTVKAKKSKPALVKKKVIKKKEAPKAVKKKADTKQAKPEKKSAVAGAVSLSPKAKTKAKNVVRKTKTVVKAALPAKKPAAKPAPRKKTPARKNEKASIQAAAKKVLAAAQLPLPAPAVPKKEAKKPVVEKAPAVSKEEKMKAGKVIKMVERSDAYRQYKKLGRRAKISEFDFRDMLFATMESSAETLRRNVDLFKRYAGIHSRADLIAFLDFAEGSFAPLLRSQAKQPARKR